MTMNRILFGLVVLFSNLVFSCNNPKTTPFSTKQYFSLLEECDACGCSANGGSMGFSSMLSDNFIGIRYFHQSYQSRDGVFNDSPWIDENFNTVQIWGRIPITNKLEVTVLVPYHFHRRVKSSGTQNVDGLGDFTLMALYRIFQTKDTLSGFKYRILVGGGIKAPIGKFDSANNGSVNPSFQVGTGSWDYSLTTENIIRKGNWGLNNALNYIIKTENDKNYKFGNQFNYGSTLFYSTMIKKVIVVPQVGVAGETFQANQEFNQDIPFTKGDIFFSKIGVEVGYRKFSTGINAMLPLNQNLTGGRVEANYRLGIHLNYSL